MAVSWECLACLVMIFVAVTDAIIPDISNVSMIIESKVCDDETPFLALNVILSHAGRQRFRDDIREVYPADEIERLGFRRVFIIAEPPCEKVKTRYGSITYDEIIKENQRYADIIQLNFTEHYKRLLYKSYATFKWASEKCTQARFVVKSDDDTFVDYYSVAKMLAEIKDDEVDALIGHDNGPGSYLAGPFYATSPKTLKLLVETAPRVEANPKFDEDVYFTANVADVVGVPRVDKRKIRPWNKHPNCCAGNGVVYKCQLIAFHREHFSRWHMSVLKMNGETCYNIECEDFSQKLYDVPGVTCSP